MSKIRVQQTTNYYNLTHYKTNKYANKEKQKCIQYITCISKNKIQNNKKLTIAQYNDWTV